MPYFTYEEYVSALSLQTPSDKLLSLIISYQLMTKLNNRPNQFFNSCNTMLSYYNNSNSRTRGLTAVQQYNNFAELSVDMRNQVICQIMTCVLSQSYARFEGDGKLMNDNSEEVESFISLGIDMTGNEYFVLYPDVLFVLSPSDKL